MTFTRGTQKEKHVFNIKGNYIENVKEYKYLGITINAKNCSFNPTLTDLSCKATNALYAINSKIPFKLLPVKTILKLFDACISPILLYGSEVWGTYMGHTDMKKWDQTPIEKVHTQFLKRMLGVNYSSTNILVRRECGRNSLQEKILNRNINYIKYVVTKNSDCLVAQALTYEITKQDSRVSINDMAKQHVIKIGAYLKGGNIWSVSRNKIKHAINQYFNELWFDQSTLFTKAETYKLFKNKTGLENYLIDTTNRKHRVIYSKFRLSDHNLMIEEGRRKRPTIPNPQSTVF